MGISGDVSVELNTEFIPDTMSAEEVKALLETWQGGGMSYNDLVYALKRGEWLREERTPEDIRDDIASEGPPPGGMSGGFGQSDTP